MSNKVLINCEEATSICDKNQYGEATLWDKIKLSLHLFMCKHCNSYSTQNKVITILLGKHLSPCEETDKLSEKDKREIETNLHRKREK